MAEKTQTTYSRASEYAKGIGETLDKIADTDVLLHGYEISNRSMRGEPKEFVSLQISTVNDPENIQDFHAWSASLAEKLQEVPQDKLPVLINFTRVATAGGFRVWTFS